jgi:hypothetical protein
MQFKVDSLELKVKPGNRAEREEEAQLRRRFEARRVRADSEGLEDPRSRNRSMGHPHGWSCWPRFIGELELAIRPFARNKFKKESLGHPATRRHSYCTWELPSVPRTFLARISS